MIPRFWMFSVWVLVAATPTQAQNVSPKVQANQGRSGGFTFRIVDSGFASPEILGRAPAAFQEPVRDAPIFFATLEIKGRDGKIIDAQAWNKGRNGTALHARIYSPNGVAIANNDLYSAYITGSVDPSWPFVTIEVYGRDPKAPDRLTPHQADGLWLENLTLDLPRPQPKQTIAVRKTLMSRLGSQVVIDSVKFTPNSTGRGGEASFAMHWKAPADAPAAELSPENPDLVDSAEKSLSNSGGEFNNNKGRFVTRFDSIPVGKTWRFRFPLQQNIPSRAVAQSRFQVRLKVPITDPKPRSPLSPDFEPVELPALKTVESLEMRVESDGVKWPGLWRGHLWLRETGPDRLLNWQVKKVAVWADDGRLLTGGTEDELRTGFWHRDGTRTPKGALKQILTADFSADEPRPKSLKVQLEMEQLRVIAHHFSLQTALPAPGKTRLAEEDVRSETGAPLTLRAIRLYNSVAELPGLSFHDNLPARGLALVFEVQPNIAGAQIRFEISSARDQLNRPLRLSSFPSWQQGHALKSGGKNFWTLILSNPAPGAKSVILESAVTEQGPVTQQLTVEIPDVPIPPIQKP